MVTSAFSALLISLITFTVLAVVTQYERRRGRRLFASQVRKWSDGVVDTVSRVLVKSFNHFTRYIIQLSWYYSIHSVLRTLLRGTITVYAYFENLFERNRARAKRLRAEKRQLSEYNHLQQMANHRVETALTPTQQQKLKHRKLEGKE